MKGYQPVELPSLDTLATHNPEHGFVRSILAWIAIRLSEQAETLRLGIDVHVITVTYLGSYPALGIVYLKPEPTDLEEWVIEEGEKLLANFSLDHFSRFVKENRTAFLVKLDEGLS